MLNAADFGDLLLECIRLFRESSRRCCASTSRGFGTSCVDEYQDTNVAQYLWLRLLGQSTSGATSAVIPGRPEDRARIRTTDSDYGFRARGLAPAPRSDAESVAQAVQAPPRTLKNICCVGDDDQSIYGWRGAGWTTSCASRRIFPAPKSFASSATTAHRPHPGRRLSPDRPQRGRLGKTLRTEDEPGEKVQVLLLGLEEEARAIGEEIEALQRGKR